MCVQCWGAVPSESAHRRPSEYAEGEDVAWVQMACGRALLRGMDRDG